MSIVLLVVGLGNPGVRYADTRHNVGFMVADRLVPDPSAFRAKFSGEFAQQALGVKRAGVLKPLTFMNVSGRSVRAAASFFKLDPGQIVVVHDELDLPFGQLRVKAGGGDAGHNGLKSVTAELGSSDYVRLRIGIGRPPPGFGGSVADFVLQAFPSVDRAVVDDVVTRAADSIGLIADRGLAAAMNTINQRSKTQ